MKKEERILEERELVGYKGVNTLLIRLNYNKGGMNYFNHRSEPRGIYISVTPLKVENRGGYVMETYVAYSGVKDFILPQARFNAKALNSLVVDSAHIETLVSHVLNKLEKLEG
jgi:hypothetical protein